MPHCGHGTVLHHKFLQGDKPSTTASPAKHAVVLACLLRCQVLESPMRLQPSVEHHAPGNQRLDGFRLTYPLWSARARHRAALRPAGQPFAAAALLTPLARGMEHVDTIAQNNATAQNSTHKGISCG